MALLCSLSVAPTPVIVPPVPTAVSNPVIYLAAPSLTPKITGDCAFSDANKIAFVHSKLLILNCPTAYPSFLALTNISFADTSPIIDSS